MTRIALIPARGSSRRIPQKNIRSFFGHPMIAYAIAAAQHAQLFDHIFVSTDDEQTGRIAEWYGAEFLRRPAELATDSAQLPDVALHVLETLGKDAESLCQLMPNCPLRRSSDIKDLYRTFEDGKRDFQLSVVSYRGVYPHWAIARGSDGKGAWLTKTPHTTPSQELQTAWCPTGAIWWVRVPAFREQKEFYGKPFFIEPMDANRGIDIDVMEELELADILVRGLTARDGMSPLEPIDRPPFSDA